MRLVGSPNCSRPLFIPQWVYVELAEGVTSNLNATSLLLRRKLNWGLDHTASGFVGRAGSIGFQQHSAYGINSGAVQEDVVKVLR